MAEITRTTGPLDAEVILPDAELSAEEAIFKQWQDTFVSPNPIQSQVEFFKDLAVMIQNGEIELEVYQYWYDKVKTSHPAVIENLPSSDVPEYQNVNESVGTLWFASPNSANTAQSDLNSCPANISSLLPTGVSQYLDASYATVNDVAADNISNIQDNSDPTLSHGASLVRDTVALTRNNDSIPLIKTALEESIGVALDLTQIENIITGDVAIERTQIDTDIEGTAVGVDELGNKVDPTLSTLNIGNLAAT